MNQPIGIERDLEIDWLERTVHLSQYPAESSRGTVLILHGLGDHIGRYQWAIELFHDFNFSVIGMDWPGCGKSSGIRGDLPLVEDAAKMVDEVLHEAGESPVGILAHSTGGFFLSWFLAHRPDLFPDLKWVWFSSPLLDPSLGQSPIKVAAAKLLVKVFPKFTLSTGVSPRDCFHILGDAAKREFAEGVHDRISLRFGESLLDPEKLAVRSAETIDGTLSVLLTQGAADHVCSPVAAEPFAKKLRALDKAFVLISGARHEPFREPENTTFFNQVRSWLGSR